MKKFPDDFHCLHGVWHPHQQDYIDYSDGAPSEKYLEEVFSSMKNIASDSLESLNYIKNWPSQYHLSPLRANLFRTLPLAKNSRVLELGSGCGAITRYLGETLQSVVAVEGSVSRAHLTRMRCRDLANVEVVAANFDDLRFHQPFDLVTLIGVLEYAGVYGRGSSDPFLSLLRSAFEHVHDQGVLILAIENKLGIKYLAGANEDHLGRPFVGLEGYLDEKTPVTFGRAELLNLLDQAGFKDYQLLLPFPDYKIPVTFINSKFTSPSEVRAYNLMDWCRQPYHDYSSTRHYFFNEYLALASTAANGLLADHANSFLVLAYKNPLTVDSIIPPIDWICKKINIVRQPSFQTRTTLENSNGRTYIKKERIHNVPICLEKPIKHVLETDSLYFQKSNSLSLLMLQALHRSSLANKKFTALLQTWLKYLLSHKLNEEKLPAHFLDCIPDNLVVDENNTLHFIDTEWHWFEPVSIIWVLVRGLVTFWTSYRSWLERLSWPGSIDSLHFLMECLGRLKLTCSPEEITAWRRKEDQLQHLVVWGNDGGAPSPQVASSSEHLLQLANEALDRHDWPATEGCLRDLTRYYPDLLEHHLSLSDVLTLQGKHLEAGEVLRAARQIDPDSSPLLKRLGLNCRRRGDLSGAVAAFTKAWNRNPKDPENLGHLGATCIDLGLFQEARGYCQEAVQINPRHIEAWLGLARVAQHLEDQEAFDQACRQAAALNPHHPRLRDLTKGRAPGNVGAAAPRPQEVREDPASGPERVLSSIIIPVFNNLSLTSQCLESIWENTDVPHEIIVVDNGSTDGTGEYLRRMEAAGGVRVIPNRTNLGFAKASNQGAQAARGDYLVFLNNDTIVQPGWLEELAACARQDEKIAAVGAKLLYPDGTIQHAGVAFTNGKLVYHIYKHYDRDHPAVNKERDFQAVTAACVLIKKDPFWAVGGFEESYRNGFEDVDLCFKMRLQGYRMVYNPRAVVYHLESRTQGRHDREMENSRMFRSKWSDVIIGDDQKYYEEDGITIEVLDRQKNAATILAHDSNDNPFWREAVRYRQAGILDQAETCYLRALQFNPFDPRKGLMARELADLYETLGKHSQAEPLHRLAAALIPQISLRGGSEEARETVAVS